ncbi:hypothetical protein HPP92_025833 [Vanilla planifolia]|uniref:Uncharacterized protein n=1 Tax=Vanilla planifolia TaxID=51239 RepID=A0A835PHB5_VANPL|nr:hypothetical protein HPP92_025833 [Vanilla planifolia]
MDKSSPLFSRPLGVLSPTPERFSDRSTSKRQINRSSRAPLRKFEPFSGILEARIGLKRSKGFEIAPLRQKEDQRQMAGGRAIFKFLGKNLNSDTCLAFTVIPLIAASPPKSWEILWNERI